MKIDLQQIPWGVSYHAACNEREKCPYLHEIRAFLVPQGNWRSWKFWRDGGQFILRNKDVQNLIAQGIFPLHEATGSFMISWRASLGHGSGLDCCFYGQDIRIARGVETVAWRSLTRMVALCGRRFGGNALFQQSVLQVLREELQHAAQSDEPHKEERKKETEEVNGATQTGDETHGGDSASGEVPDGVSQSGDAAPDSDAPEMGAKAKDAQAQMRREMRKAVRQARQRGSPGSGATAEFKAAQMSLVRQCQAALATLTSAGADEQGPRWDAQQLVERLKTYRPLPPARKYESARPIILVIADVSGSCAPFSEDACAVAQAAAALGVGEAAVVTVRVTNVWCVEEVRINGRVVSYQPDNVVTPDTFARWVGTKVGGNLQAVIGLGDSDEESSYQAFAAIETVQRVIWIDNYDCNRIGRAERRNLGNWPRPLAAKLQYFVGAGNASAMVGALRQASQEDMS